MTGRVGARDRRRPLRARTGRRRRRRRVARRARRAPARRADRRARLQGAAAPDAAAGRGHDDRRLPDRAGPARVRARRSRGRVRRRGAAGAGGRGGDGGARPRAPRCRAGSRAPMRARLRERGSEELYDRIELPLTAVLASMEDAGIKIDTYRMGEITARLADRVEELESTCVRARGRGVHARLDAAARAHPLREARADAGPQGQDRATRPTRASCARSATSTRSSR